MCSSPFCSGKVRLRTHFVHRRSDNSTVLANESNRRRRGNSTDLVNESNSTLQEVCYFNLCFIALFCVSAGKSGNLDAILRLAKILLVSVVEKRCREAEKEKPSDRSFGDIVLPMTNDWLSITFANYA